MGEVERAGPWYCGPEQDRGAYVVADLGGIEGGQGLVLRAERRSFAGDPVGYSGPVALKLLEGTPAERVATLRSRWAVLAKLEHPNLARPLEIFEGPGLSRTPRPDVRPDEARDVCYVTTTWVEGTGLRELAPLGPPAAFRMAQDIAAGLAVLHGNGLLHRDLHPGNVIVDETGRSVLIDFGTARPDDGTMTATVSGVMGFIAPECVHGPGTAASDRWGLGMLTVFALLGHPQGSTRPERLRAELQRALDGIGRRQQAVDLLRRMIDDDPHRRPPDITAWAGSLAACLPPRSPRRRLLLPAATAAGVALVAGAGLVLVADDDIASRSPGPTTPRCPPAPGGAGGDDGDGSSGTVTSAPPAAPPPGEAAEVPRRGTLDDAVEDLAAGACLGGPPQVYAQAAVQPLVDREGRAAGVVMVSPAGDTVRLTEAMWISYRATKGPNMLPSEVPRGGYPIAVERRHDPEAVVVELDRSGILVGPRDDSQMFWVPAQVLELWEVDHGGPDGDLGFPLSNPYANDVGLHLEFERGTMHAYGDAAAVAEMAAGGPVTPVIERQDPEPLTERSVDVTEHIVQQARGTAWWVDAEGVRHWIPDMAVFDCLGGADAVALNRLRGWDIATLPLGPPATCP